MMLSCSQRMASLPRASRSAVVGPHRDGRSPMVRSTVPDLRNPTRPSRRFSCSAAATEPIIAQTPAAEMLMQELAACAAASKTGGLHQQSRVPVVVMFTASWCGPCQMMAKELNRLKEERGDEVKILFIDVDENKELAGALNVSTLPTTMFIGRANCSRPAISVVGVTKLRKLEDLLDSKMHVAGSRLETAIRMV